MYNIFMTQESSFGKIPTLQQTFEFENVQSDTETVVANDGTKIDTLIQTLEALRNLE